MFGAGAKFKPSTAKKKKKTRKVKMYLLKVNSSNFTGF
jgi:hypothetical protein